MFAVARERFEARHRVSVAALLNTPTGRSNACNYRTHDAQGLAGSNDRWLSFQEVRHLKHLWRAIERRIGITLREFNA